MRTSTNSTTTAPLYTADISMSLPRTTIPTPSATKTSLAALVSQSFLFPACSSGSQYKHTKCSWHPCSRSTHPPQPLEQHRSPQSTTTTHRPPSHQHHHSPSEPSSPPRPPTSTPSSAPCWKMPSHHPPNQFKSSPSSSYSQASSSCSSSNSSWEWSSSPSPAPATKK